MEFARSKTMEELKLFQESNIQDSMRTLPASTYVFEADIIDLQGFELSSKEISAAQETSLKFWNDDREGKYDEGDGEAI